MSTQSEQSIKCIQRDQLAYPVCHCQGLSKDILDIMDWLPCFNHAHFDLWGFLLYSHLSRLRSDQDLVTGGINIASHTYRVGEMVIPPRPFLTLNLGQGCHQISDVEGLISKGQPTPHHRHHSCCHGRERDFEAHYTFARAEHHPDNHKEQPNPDFDLRSGVKRPSQPKSATGLTLKRRKGMSVEDLIGPF
ncbi:hypothetical protein F5B20DRAFT_509363 [Whalleya microplaca]|nr:hypothetical protein F5B20DRAFT_509363 [Whalleya microplaca]